MKTIVFSHAAARDMGKLPREARAAVTKALVGYAVSGNGDVSKLSGRDGYQMRVGPYRVIFAEDATTVLAIYIGRRTATTYRGD
jgi:mRNA interferase RelE/StbE